MTLFNQSLDILIIDDHRLFLDGMRYLVKRLADDVAVTTAESVQSAINQLERGERFNLAITDITMPGMDGFSFLKAMSARRISCPTVVISGSDDTKLIRRARQEGALGYIPKHADSVAMLAGLKKVLDGELYFPPAAFLAEDKHSSTSENENEQQALGDQQLKVLYLLADGYANKQISEVLSISESTVKYHIQILYQYFGVNRRTACVMAARRQNLLE